MPAIVKGIIDAMAILTTEMLKLLKEINAKACYERTPVLMKIRVRKILTVPERLMKQMKCFLNQMCAGAKTTTPAQHEAVSQCHCEGVTRPKQSHNDL